MPQLLIARPAPWWRQALVTVLLIVTQVVVGLIVLVLRTARAVLTLAATAGDAIERLLAARTGQPVLSQTGIAAVAVVFANEFLAAHHQPTR